MERRLDERRAESSPERTTAEVATHRFADASDPTLVDLLLEQSISDRLRSLCRYVNALEGFRRV